MDSGNGSDLIQFMDIFPRDIRYDSESNCIEIIATTFDGKTSFVVHLSDSVFSEANRVKFDAIQALTQALRERQ